PTSEPHPPAATPPPANPVPLVRPIRFDTPGLKPLLVERNTSYRTTPTLSLDAAQLNASLLPLTLTANPAGTLGGLVSPATTALAWFDGALRLPAASSASTR